MGFDDCCWSFGVGKNPLFCYHAWQKMKKLVCYTLLVETSPQALPLGAACIASSLKNSVLTKSLVEVSLMENSVEDPGYTEDGAGRFIASEILCGGVPDFVLYSVFVWNRRQIFDSMRVLKSLHPKIVFIAGGPEVTADPESFSDFDYAVSGQGEEAVPSIVHELCSGGGSLSSRKIHHGTVSDLKNLSSPYLDGTLDLKKYGGALWELARGCPFRCSYCYESKGEKKIRYFPMERIERELELFRREGIRQVFVLDPTYNAGKERALRLIDLISRKAPGIFFYFEARAEFMDRELASAFTRIKCALQFGLQSSNPEVLSLVNRSFDRKKFSRNIGYLNEAGVVFGLDLIYGLPGDCFDGFRDSVDYALGLYPNNLETFRLSVLPGTDLFDDAERLGLVFERNAPYRVVCSTSFSEGDMERAENLSHSCNVFYNQGRAVPWFNALCHHLKKKPSGILRDFSRWVAGELGVPLSVLDFECRSQREIEKIQCDFLTDVFEKRRCGEKSIKIMLSIVRLNGALSRLEESGVEQYVELDFHPDALLCEYGSDIRFLEKNLRPFANRTKCFFSRGAVDWKVV